MTADAGAQIDLRSAMPACYTAMYNIFILYGGKTMADIKLTDVTIHMDREPDADTRDKVETALRELHGVVSVHMPENRKHLLIVEYNPDVTAAAYMLETVNNLAGHSEMIGL
jgi:hypothetical protein